MQAYKAPIAFLLLLGFLSSQVNSYLHYLLVPHSFSSESKTAFVEPDLNFQYHSCYLHLHGFSSDLPPENNFPELNTITTAVAPCYNSLENYVHQQDFNFQLRGPPHFSIVYRDTRAS